MQKNDAVRRSDMPKTPGLLAVRRTAAGRRKLPRRPTRFPATDPSTSSAAATIRSTPSDVDSHPVPAPWHRRSRSAERG